MSDDTEREIRPAGRSIQVLAFGDTVTEIEMAALDVARKFFGTDLRMQVVPDYVVMIVLKGMALEAQAGGKVYQASMTVRVIES